MFDLYDQGLMWQEFSIILAGLASRGIEYNPVICMYTMSLHLHSIVIEERVISSCFFKCVTVVRMNCAMKSFDADESRM